MTEVVVVSLSAARIAISRGGCAMTDAYVQLIRLCGQHGLNVTGRCGLPGLTDAVVVPYGLSSRKLKALPSCCRLIPGGPAHTIVKLDR